MAVIKQGILGAFSGKVGNVVGSSWKGIGVVKSLPASVANPDTAGQQAQRGAFGSAVAFAGVILASVIKPLWDRFASGMSGFNSFISTNITSFTTAGLTSPQTLVISTGKMASTALGDITKDVSNLVVSAEWQNDEGEGFKLAADKAYLVAYDATTKEIVYSAAAATRENELASVTFSAVVTGHTIHCWLAFRRADGTIVSETSYKSQAL